jgi:hypothetical protein
LNGLESLIGWLTGTVRQTLRQHFVPLVAAPAHPADVADAVAVAAGPVAGALTVDAVLCKKKSFVDLISGSFQPADGRSRVSKAREY